MIEIGDVIVTNDKVGIYLGFGLYSREGRIYVLNIKDGWKKKDGSKDETASLDMKLMVQR